VIGDFCIHQQEKLYKELMEVAQKKQSEIQLIIVSAIASERSAVLQLASDFQFDGNAACVSFEIIFIYIEVDQCYYVASI